VLATKRRWAPRAVAQGSTSGLRLASEWRSPLQTVSRGLVMGAGLVALGVPQRQAIRGDEGEKYFLAFVDHLDLEKGAEGAGRCPSAGLESRRVALHAHMIFSRERDIPRTSIYTWPGY